MEIILDKVYDTFSFFVKSDAEYATSRLKRVMKFITLQMKVQLRNLIYNSVDDFM